MVDKRRNRFLAVGIIILVLIAYQFAFKKTFELKSKIGKKLKDKTQLENANDRIRVFQQENAQLDSILQSNDLSVDQSFVQTLFQKLTLLSNNHKVKVVSFDKPHTYSTNQGTVQSYTIEVKGDFRDLMLFSSSLEQFRLGKFSSVNFLKKKNYKTRRNELSCKIILQRLSK